MRQTARDPLVNEPRPEDGVQGAAKRSRPSWPKRKVALMLGYSGAGYQGMQLNPGAKTIESELFAALCKEGLVSEDNAEDPKKVAWMRACRTDKGVHAAGQVVSLKMLLKDKEDGSVPDNALGNESGNEAVTEAGDLLQRLTVNLNSHLPEQIRIFGIKRTTGSFHAKERTDSRFYEYLMPTYVLTPVARDAYLPSSIPATQADGEAAEESERWDGILPQITPQDKARIESFRVTPGLLDATRAILSAYRGSHSFHNFTIGMSSTDLSAKRYIIDIKLGEPFIAGGLEWISVRFHGQSFMLHQIRKMIGLVIMAVRLGLGPEIVARCFGPGRVNIPRAPALGLLLDKAVLAQYNERNPEHPPINFDEYEQERTALKNTHIYPRIYAEEATYSRFWGWLKCNDDHASEFSFLLSP